MKRYYLLALMACSVVALVLMAASPSEAIHRGAGNLVCGGCHTMHNSQGGTTAAPDNLGGAAGGSVFLLRGDTSAGTFNFCLNCHADDGAQAGTSHAPHGEVAPKVLSDGAWTETDGFDLIGAGGDFQPVCGDVSSGAWDCATEDTNESAGPATGKGHSLGRSAVPPGDAAATAITIDCTSCHDPHGTADPAHVSINIFRNLKLDPNTNNAGSYDLNTTAVSGNEYTFGFIGSQPDAYVPETDGSANANWPVATDTPKASLNNTNSNQYTSVGARSGIAGFCSDCHASWHEVATVANVSSDDWKRHPVDYVINDADTAGNGSDTIDWTHYTNVDSSTVDNNRTLPAAHEGWESTNAYFANANDEDKVFCLSCHFAHGGPYFDNLRWDYLSTVGVAAQTGKGVGSDTGCQQCHNRGG